MGTTTRWDPELVSSALECPHVPGVGNGPEAHCNRLGTARYAAEHHYDSLTGQSDSRIMSNTPLAISQAPPRAKAWLQPANRMPATVAQEVEIPSVFVRRV